MTLIVWNENLSVNIKSIDEQHKKLIDMINDFYDNIATRSNNENISKLVGNMKQYVKVHFTTEEVYMKKFGYLYYDEHRKEHAQFVSKIDEIEEKINSGKLVMSLDMTTFLKDWLKNHILVSDKKYTDFFIEKGVK